MPEAFVWPEGQVYISTAISGALIAYAQNTQANLTLGWDNHITLDGVYNDTLTGQRADVNIGALYTQNALIQRMFDQTALPVHFKFVHTTPAGSAGHLLWSGRIDSLAYIGRENAPFTYQLTYHANVWSGF